MNTYPELELQGPQQQDDKLPHLNDLCHGESGCWGGTSAHICNIYLYSLQMWDVCKYGRIDARSMLLIIDFIIEIDIDS